MDEQYALIENNYSNISRILVKYGKFCKGIINNPKQRLMFWLSKED